MNTPPDKLLRQLEPPPGGSARLLSRRDSLVRSAPPPWLALAAGAATALVWIAALSGHTEVRMQLTGARLIGERTQGVSVQMLEGGRAVPLSADAAEVPVYWVERSGTMPPTPK